MNLTDKIEIKAALESAQRQIPFALFAFPGSDDYRFFANPGGKKDGGTYFVVNRWNTTFAESLRIYAEMDAATLLSKADALKPQPSRSPLQYPSTAKKEYIEKISTLIATLKERGGKTVFSRIISQEGISIDLGKLIECQFSSFPDTFRFLYYTPQTGLWMGTSPELLLEYDAESRRFRTMSLAGTRVTDSTGWDNKNIHEQNLVAEFITGVLIKNGAQFSVKRCKDVHFKPVCHICDMFSGTLPTENCTELLNQLSPTPALSGFPVDTAIQEIESLESHKRECYGGYVGLVTPKGLKCYVNLRSVKLSETGYCIFAGGGVTPQSNPQEEWNETENKTVILRENIAKASMANKKETKPGKAFPILLIALVIVAAVSLLPLNRASNGKLKDFSLWSDLFPKENITQIGAETYIDPDLEEIKADSPDAADQNAEELTAETGEGEGELPPLPEPPKRKEGEPLAIEDFSGARLPKFRAAMARRDSRPVRIAIIGDSYIEGDIFSQNIREKLQEQYGGHGVGYLPVSSDLTGFRQSIRQTCSGWEKHDFRNNGKKYPILSGIYFTPEEGNALTTVKGSKKMAHSATWNNSKFLFIAPSATTVTVTIGDGEPHIYDVEPSEKVQAIELQGETGELKFSTPSTDLIALGLYLNDNSGIAVDNMSIRGYSGIKHNIISTDLASQMRQWADYDLIIIEYGINALTSDTYDYAYYTRAMEKSIARIKEAYPNADIIVMGIGDRGEKIGSEVHSMKSVPYMVDQQRKMARKLGVAFWDTREAMGGEDAIVEWTDHRDTNKDYIHLSFNGGDRLATLFVQSLNQLLND